MIKEEFEEIKSKNGIYFLKKDGNFLKHKPWLGDIFSSLYDFFMRKTVFPKKLNASIDENKYFLKNKLGNIHNKNVLELATGSGKLSEVLSSDNNFVGIDISKGLLKIANRRFLKNGFENPRFYVCGVEKLPFKDNIFDVCVCNLSLNFFDDLEIVIKEIKRVLKNKGFFFCSAPVPERKINKSKIRGELRSEEKLKEMFEKNNFVFYSYDFDNGTILYFRTDLNEN